MPLPIRNYNPEIKLDTKKEEGKAEEESSISNKIILMKHKPTSPDDLRTDDIVSH